MPLNGATFYGPKTGNGSETAYYYVEVLPGESGTNHNGVTYKLHHSDTSPGTGYSVTEEDKYPITGFTYKEGTPNHSRYNNAKFYYTRNSYVIKFMNNGAADKTVNKKFEQSIADESYTPTAPASLKDYTFGGWYENDLCEGTPFDFSGKTMPAQNITLFAKWNAPTYTVTFYDADGKQVGDSLTVPKGEEISTDDAPAETALNLKEGESFLGWVIGSVEGTPFNFDTKITHDYHLYAKVGDGNEYTVTYFANGGTGTVTDATKYSKDAYADVKSAAGLTAPTGKVFLGWSTDDKAAAAEYHPADKVSMAGGNVTLYAVWGDQAQAVELTYHANGGNGDDIKETYPNNTLVTLKGADAFTRTGYTLTGWNTKGDGTGTTFGVGASARVDNIDSNDLYAIWTPNADTAYKVEFYYQTDDQSGYTLDHTDNRTGTTDTTASVTAADKAAKENGKYVFDENNANNVLSSSIAADGSLVLKLYFKLNQFDYTVNYYWNGTTDKVAESESGKETYNASVTRTPEEVEGYTPVSRDSQTLTITNDEKHNVINFYYYKDVELKANSDSKVYNGAEHEVSGFTGAPEGADFSAITVGAKGTDAGEYPANFKEGTVGTVDATKKYIVKEANNGQLTITPVTAEVVVRIKGNKATYEYDATEKRVTGYTVESISNNLYKKENFSLAENAKAEARGTDAGEYLMGLTEKSFVNNSKNFVNVKFVVEDGKLTITKRAVTFTGESAERVYNATEQELTGITASGLVDGHTYENLTYSAKGTDSGEYDGVFSDVGKLVIKDKGIDVTTNYVVTTTPGKLTITKAEKLEVKVIGKNCTVNYNGKMQFVEGFTHNAPADVTVELKAGKKARPKA